MDASVHPPAYEIELLLYGREGNSLQRREQQLDGGGGGGDRGRAMRFTEHERLQPLSGLQGVCGGGTDCKVGCILGPRS